MGLISGLYSSRYFAVICPMPLYVLLLMLQGGGTSGRGARGHGTGGRTRPVAKAVCISYILAERRLPRGIHSYDASTGPRAIARGDAR